MQNDATLKNEKKRYIIYAALVAVVIGLVLLIGGVSGSRRAEVALDSGIDEDEDTSVYAVFKNQYQLEYSVSKSVSDRVFAELYRKVIDVNEIAVSPRENQAPQGYSDGAILAELNEGTFSGIRVDSGVGYKFELDTSDGRIYDVYVRTSEVLGVNYYAVLVLRSTPDADTAELLVTILIKDTEDFSRSGIIAELTEWAKTVLPGKDLLLTVKDEF